MCHTLCLQDAGRTWPVDRMDHRAGSTSWAPHPWVGACGSYFTDAEEGAGGVLHPLQLPEHPKAKGSEDAHLRLHLSSDTSS